MGFGWVIGILVVGVLLIIAGQRTAQLEMIQVLLAVSPDGKVGTVMKNFFQLVAFLGLGAMIWGMVSVFTFNRELGHESIDIGLIMFGIIMYMIPHVWELRLRVHALESRLATSSPPEATPRPSSAA